MLAILIALPGTADAQDGSRAGRNSGRTQARTAEPRGSEQAQPEQRQAVQRGDDRRNDRQGDRNSRQSDRDRQNERSSGLTPLGLPPQRQQQLPWWEQRQVPSWERQQLPWWEQRQGTDPVLVNPSRAAIELNRKAREAERVQRPRGPRPQVVYVLPPYRYFPSNSVYGYGVESSTYVTPAPPQIVEAPAPPPPDVTHGYLRLEVEPRQALQIFVDGLYIGTPADLGDEFELRLGARRIELRAPGYRTLVFDTQIVPDRTIVYRGALELIGTSSATPAPRAPSAPDVPAERKKIYMIPGCYMGNVEPTAAMLRPGCDLSKLITSSP